MSYGAGDELECLGAQFLGVPGAGARCDGIDRTERMATARAMAKTTCIVVPKRIFDRVLKQSNPIVVTMLNTLLRRLRSESGANVKRTL